MNDMNDIFSFIQNKAWAFFNLEQATQLIFSICVKNLCWTYYDILVLLVFVALVEGHITVANQGPFDKDSHGTPAQHNYGHIKKIPVAPEVKPPLLLQQLTLPIKRKNCHL